MSEPATSSAQTFSHDGFWIADSPIVDAETISAARAGMEELRRGDYDTGRSPEESPWNPGDDPRALCKIEQPQRASRAIAALIRSPGIGAAAAAATGAAMVQVWWVQLLWKPPAVDPAGAAPRVGWHRDWNYWHGSFADGSELLTAWIAIDDVGDDCGPVLFVPGSHRWEDQAGGDFREQGDNAGDFAVPAGTAWREVAATMPAGAISLHHRDTLHGSRENRSGRPRLSFAIHLRTERSRPRRDRPGALSRFVDDSELAPIVHGERVEAAF